MGHAPGRIFGGRFPAFRHVTVRKGGAVWLPILWGKSGHSCVPRFEFQSMPCFRWHQRVPAVDCWDCSSRCHKFLRLPSVLHNRKYVVHPKEILTISVFALWIVRIIDQIEYYLAIGGRCHIVPASCKIRGWPRCVFPLRSRYSSPSQSSGQSLASPSGSNQAVGLNVYWPGWDPPAKPSGCC